MKAFFVNTSIHCISALFFLYKCLNRTLVMPEVLRPDALGKLIHYYIFYKCLNRTLVMPEVLKPDALGKLIHYYIFYKCLNRTIVMPVLEPDALGKFTITFFTSV